jgi:hypothetical protein
MTNRAVRKDFRGCQLLKLRSQLAQLATNLVIKHVIGGCLALVTAFAERSAIGVMGGRAMMARGGFSNWLRCGVVVAIVSSLSL